MSTFTLHIELGNDAMQTPADVARVLHRLADGLANVEFGGGGRIPDVNGNTIGRWAVDEDSPLPEPPAHLADAWQRFQAGEMLDETDTRKLDEWRADCAAADGY